MRDLIRLYDWRARSSFGSQVNFLRSKKCQRSNEPTLNYKIFAFASSLLETTERINAGQYTLSNAVKLTGRRAQSDWHRSTVILHVVAVAGEIGDEMYNNASKKENRTDGQT